MRRGTGDSDDTKGRGYLIAPPPLFPLVPAFARQTYRYEIDAGKRVLRAEARYRVRLERLSERPHDGY